MTRRNTLIMIARLTLFVLAFVAALSGLNFSPAAFSTNDIVRVEGGQISGTNAEGVRSYKGIPYAAPPTGEWRWKPPQPVKAWDGVRACNEYGPDCPQAPYPQASLFYSPPRPQSEDCLYLNVWTAARAGEKRPVMVWIHGGALTRGSGRDSHLRRDGFCEKRRSADHDQLPPRPARLSRPPGA